MFVLIKDRFALSEMADSHMLLKLNPDGKTFTIIKDKFTGQTNTVHHNSMLKHFILFGVPQKELEENDEETNRVSRRET
jgi:hypothetical protein